MRAGVTGDKGYGIFLTDGSKALLCLFMESAILWRVRMEGFVCQGLLERVPVGKKVFGGWREVAVDQALPDVVHSLYRGVQHVGVIEAVVAEFVEDEFVGRKIMKADG